MPRQIGEVYSPSDPAILYSGPGLKWIISDDTLVGSGNLVSDGTGGSVTSTYGLSELVNRGTVYNNLGGNGVEFHFDSGIGNGCSVLNKVGAVIVGHWAVHFSHLANSTITNDGSISGAYNGIYADEIANFRIRNDGDIYGYNAAIQIDRSRDGAVIIENSGTIHGKTGIAYYTPDPVSLTLINRVDGIIEGSVNEAIVTSGGSLNLKNLGLVEGEIRCDAGVNAANDKIINKGTITGDIHLVDGDDIFVFAGGKQGTVFGEGGADRFDFKGRLVAEKNAPTIMNFNTPDSDTIGLSKGLFKGLGGKGILESKYFVVGTKAQDGHHKVIYDNTTGNLYYDHDGQGGGNQKLFAHVISPGLLDHSDFVVI